MSVEDVTGVADEQLAAFIDRILRMKDEADAIAADIREIYAEAKAMGFDKTQLGNVITYLRKKEKDASKLEEGEAVFDLYLGSYLATKNRVPHVRAYARASNGPETTEPQTAPQAAQDGGAFSEVKGSARLENAVGVEPSPSNPIQPETANELPPPSRGIGGEDDLRELAATVPGQIAQEGDAPLKASANVTGEGVTGHAAHLSTDTEDPTRTPAGVVVTDRNGVTGGESAATITHKPIRPHCLKPNSCGGMGRKHCYTCEQAREKVSA